LDLYNKLTIRLQEKIAITLNNLLTYKKLAACCLSLDAELKRINAYLNRQKRPRSDRNSLATPIGARAGRQATSALIPKAVITIHRQALPNQLHTMPLTSTYRNTPINPASATCYNCDKEGYFTSSYPELGDIKEIEEEEIYNKLGKKEP